MKINSSIHLSQSQKLVMTPQMQQSIKLLHLPSTELNQYLQQFLLENPFLEQESSEEQLQDLPHNTHDEEDRFQSEWANIKSSKRKNQDHDLPIAEQICQNLTLQDSLKDQLCQNTTNSLLREIGFYIIDLIEDDGYLKSELETISHESKYSLENLEKTLSIIQKFSPSGVGARNLGECLKLQLQDKSLLTDTLIKILDNLPQLVDIGPQKLAKSLKIEETQLRNALDLFKSLNPKPGLIFSSQSPLLHITPDVIIRQDHCGNWVCDLNDSALPRFFIDRESYVAVSNKETSSQVRQYINSHISNANWLLKSLRQRALTILSVSQVLIKYQSDFLNHGKTFLKPLTLKDIAMELNIHESTVSRTVTGKYALTPLGTIELKEFLSGAIQRNPSQQESVEISSKVVQLKIKEFINNENKQHPLSDDKLVSCLNEVGFKVARRTVSKYREVLKIPSSNDRKRLCRLLTF